MNLAVKVYCMHEQGLNFVEIAKQIGGTAKEAAVLWTKADIAKDKAKNKVKVVYRKRMTTSTKHHKQLTEKMVTLCQN